MTLMRGRGEMVYALGLGPSGETHESSSLSVRNRM